MINNNYIPLVVYTIFQLINFWLILNIGPISNTIKRSVIFVFIMSALPIGILLYYLGRMGYIMTSYFILILMILYVNKVLNKRS